MPVRLTGASRPYAGRVEVYRAGIWLPISASAAINATQVGAAACARLGYARSIVDTHNSYSNPAVSPQWSSVDCTGMELESDLMACSFGGWTAGTDELGVECFNSTGQLHLMHCCMSQGSVKAGTACMFRV